MARPVSIYRVERLDCSIESHDWRFARECAGEIERHWRELRVERPSLFDGPIYLAHAWRREEGALTTRHFETGFRNFIAWRDFGFPDDSIRNSFSMAAVRSADGAWMLARMGEHTANAGRIYFPAGTPDRGDVAGGALDLAGSACRELEEETGLTPDLFEIAPDWRIVDAGPRLACLKIFQARESAKVLSERVGDFLARDRQPELSGVVSVRTRVDIDAVHMPDFIVAFLQSELAV